MWISIVWQSAATGTMSYMRRHSRTCWIVGPDDNGLSMVGSGKETAAPETLGDSRMTSQRTLLVWLAALNLLLSMIVLWRVW
jgi:hypothetical protein